MKTIVIAVLLPLLATSLDAAQPNPKTSTTLDSKFVRIDLKFGSNIADSVFASEEFSLVNGSNAVLQPDLVHRWRNDTTKLSLIFNITPKTYGFLQDFVSDKTPLPLSNFSIKNMAPIHLMGSDSIKTGELENVTRGRIPDVSDSQWKSLVLDYYALDYMFPHTLKLSSVVPTKDSSQEIVLELDQSATYAMGSDWYWGIQSRWGTSARDSFNFVKAYPIVGQYAWNRANIAGFMSAETGPEGFKKYGKGTVGAMINLIIPFVPLGFLRFGHDRLAKYPQLTLKGTGGVAWSDTAIISSKDKYPIDLAAGLNYDFPIWDKYYFESDAKLVGSSAMGFSLKNYEYQVALGYIEKGSFKILLSYKQGLGEVSYHYDKQLLIGLAMDLLKGSI